MSTPDLGTIGRLAEDLRAAARAVIDDMKPTPSGDAYVYLGSITTMDAMITAVNALEAFQDGWI